MVAKKDYSSRFTNQYGEEWLFEYNEATGEGVLSGSDLDWKPYPVIDGRAIDLLMSDEEIIWLRAYWAQAIAKRSKPLAPRVRVCLHLTWRK